MNNRYLEWYVLNLNALTWSGYIKPENTKFYNQINPILKISGFSLPENFKQKLTELMIIFPQGDNIFFERPNFFYVDQNLKLKKGGYPEHVFDFGIFFNDLSDKKWARFSYHIKKWNPTRDVVSGSSLFDLLESIKKGLSEVR